MRLTVLLCACLLAGCAGRVLTSNERSVIVQAGAAVPGEAQAVADVECKKHGRVARLSMKNNAIQYVFDCVN